MQRTSHALLLVIALAGGLTAGIMVDRAPPAVYPGLAAGPETGRAFYDALNMALAGGGADALAALLSPSFLDHDANSGVSQSSAAFLDRVAMLGQTANVAPMVVDEIEVSGGNLIVHLGHTTELSEVAGISIQQSWDQPALEVLRVAQGRVIDRWSSGGINWIEANELGAIALHAFGQTDMATSLMRIDIPAGVVHQLASVGTGFLLVESGVARMHLAHRDGSDETYELGAGVAVPVTSGDHIQLRSVDDEPVKALAYALKRRTATEGSEAILPTSALHAHAEGVHQSLLWSGVPPRIYAGTLHRAGTTVLPAGGGIRLTASASVTLLLAIDSGTLEVLAPGSTIEILGDDFWPADQNGFAYIDANRAASVIAEGEITLRNATEHPVRVLLITIEPETNRA